MTNSPHPDHDGGLEFDLGTMFTRRRTLGLMLGAGAVAGLSACTPAPGGGTAATTGYESSKENFPNTPLAGDMVFGNDGGSHQPASTAGSVAAGYTAALNVII
ncbi:MAG: hypothetical protein ABIN10_01385 [Specibacter sp.]